MSEATSMDLFTQIANEVGISGRLFVKFMVKRFPTEASPCYIREWAERFKTGDPVRYMDMHSLSVYKDIIEAL